MLRVLVCAALAAGVSACDTTPTREGPLPPTMEAGPQGGGYYLDDGPGANPPANLDTVPDAVPRTEPLNAAAARPYTVNGRRYTPMTVLRPYKARGTATWYGRRYHGKQTSSGEIYDMYAMTAAHATLPIPSYARVTNLANRKSVVVRINDRGPFIGNRLIDLSYTAAYRLGLLAGGSARVEVESIVPANLIPASAPPETREAAVATAPAQPASEPMPAAVPLTAPDPVAVDPVATGPAPAVQSAVHGVYVQFGAFQSRHNAEGYLAKLKGEVGWLAERLGVAARSGLFRVQAGPYATPAEARQIVNRIGDVLGSRPILLTW